MPLKKNDKLITDIICDCQEDKRFLSRII